MRQKTNKNGAALISVMLFMALLLAVWAGTNHKLTSNTQIEKTQKELTDQRRGQVLSLMLGLNLLETGLPKDDLYSCTTEVSQNNETKKYVLTFIKEDAFPEGVSKKKQTRIYSVKSQLLNSDDEGIPKCPDKFKK